MFICRVTVLYTLVCFVLFCVCRVAAQGFPFLNVWKPTLRGDVMWMLMWMMEWVSIELQRVWEMSLAALRPH